MKRYLRRLRRCIRVASGKDLALRPISRATTRFHGSEYGGWAVVTGSVSASSKVYSFGIGEDASFDLSLIESYGCTIDAFDPTPKSIAWSEKNIYDPRFVMHPWALGDADGKLRLHLPRNRDFVSASMFDTSITSDEYFDAECYTLRTILDKLGHASVDVLKMDIEGAEYGVVANLIESGTIARVDQLLVEFHHWIPEIGLAPTRQALASLEKAGFKIHWVSKGGHEVLFRRHLGSGTTVGSR